MYDTSYFRPVLLVYVFCITMVSCKLYKFRYSSMQPGTIQLASTLAASTKDAEFTTSIITILYHWLLAQTNHTAAILSLFNVPASKLFSLSLNCSSKKTKDQKLQQRLKEVNCFSKKQGNHKVEFNLFFKKKSQN